MEKFAVYNASAGSGKTTVLAIEYIILTLQNPEKYKRILAVTFTNKAAAEMKERIISYLKSLSLGKYEEVKPLKENLSEIEKRTSLNKEQIRDRANKTLQLILHNYSDFAVKTIDSFIHRIVRTFAYDLHLPIDFDIETDSDKLLNQAVDILISKAGMEEDLTSALVEFTEEKTDDNKSWHIENDLFNFSKILLDEEGQINTDKLKNLSLKDFEKVRKNIQGFIKFFEEQLQKIAVPVYQKIKEIGVMPQAFANGKNGIMKYLEYVVDKRFDKLKPSATVQRNMAEGKWYSGKATAEEKGKIDSLKSSISKAYNEIGNFADTYYSKYLVLQNVYQKLYPLAVLNETDKILQEIKSQNNLMHISDFNKKVSQIVLSEPVPFIYERVGEHFEHFFIDEFQDTSVMQWQNMLPLIDNSLASNNFNMVVGDGKQAIYRWRNGNVEQFINLPNVEGQDVNEVIAERAAALHRNYKKIELNSNYRSMPVIVDFNNDFFSHISSILEENHRKVYQGLAQKPIKDDGGYVSIEFLDVEKENYDEEVFRKTEEIINSLESSYELKDIGVLCRSNKEANTIAEYLLLKGIHVVSSESLLLCNSEKVNFIISLLKIMDSPNDSIALTAAINYLHNTKKTSQSLHQAFTQIVEAEKMSSSHEKLHFLLKSFAPESCDLPEGLHILPVYDLCEELLRAFNLHHDNDPFLAFFLEMVWSYSNTNSSGVSGLLEWWEENKLKQFIVVPQGLNAVNIMTIHKAKGLQFPVVIYPFADEKLKATKDTFWVQSQYVELGSIQKPIIGSNSSLLETEYADTYSEEQNRSLMDLVNILYVTLTRPEEKLFIISKMPGEKEQNSIPVFFKDYLQAKSLWENEKLNYEFGDNQLVVKNKVEEEKNIPPVYKQLISTQWQEKVRIAQNAETVWSINDYEENRTWGNILHSILAFIKMPDDLSAALKKAQDNGWINESQKEEIQKKLESMLRNEAIAEFFDKNTTIYTEKEILTGSGQIFRPDRIVLTKNKIIVIDYKTGKEEARHKKQINSYAQLLSDMGYKIIEQYLLYIEDERLVKC